MIQANGLMITSSVEEIISTLKTQLALNGIQRFYKTIQTNRNVMTCCPFHKNGQEHKPSFGILESDGTCHCFACGWVGSLSEMISNCFGYDDLGNYGSKWLVRNFVSVSFSERPALDLNIDRHKNVPQQNYVTEAELDAYRYTHNYLYERGLTDEIIELFDLGYDHNTDSITFPVRDINGHCLFVARRKVKYKRYEYPAGVKKPLYGLYEITKWFDSFSKDHSEALSIDFDDDVDSSRPIGVNFPQEVIICEGMFDALTCWVYGKQAVALNGLGNDLQFKQLRELPCRELILATDMDEAGLKARERIKKNVPNKLVKQYIWDINVAKDVNGMSKEFFDNLHANF